MTITELQNLIGEKMIEIQAKDLKAFTNETPEKLLRWFIAYQIAKETYEVNTIKDWAHLIQDGVRPLNNEDIKTWLQSISDSYEETLDDGTVVKNDVDGDAYIIKVVNLFFGR